MIDVARVDYWAANGSGPFHRASVLSKLLFLALVVAAAVASRDPYPLAVGTGMLVVLAALAGLPWAAIGALSMYAAVFALLYAVSLRGDGWTYAVLRSRPSPPRTPWGWLLQALPTRGYFRS